MFLYADERSSDWARFSEGRLYGKTNPFLVTMPKEEMQELEQLYILNMGDRYELKTRIVDSGTCELRDVMSRLTFSL